jgi:hypothetical protein
MRIPRVRFTIRRMMIAVALVALSIVGTRQGLRWYRISRDSADRVAGLRTVFPLLRTMMEQSKKDIARYERKLEEYSLTSDKTGDLSEYDRNNILIYERIISKRRKMLAREQRCEDYFIQLRAKYQRRIYRPWLPEEPDPPEPE